MKAYKALENETVYNGKQSAKRKKKRHKLRAMTNGEFCQKWKKEHAHCRNGAKGVACPLFRRMECATEAFKKKPFKTEDGKYIFVEVKE